MEEDKVAKEGLFLLGDPNFVEFDVGGRPRLRCVESGHEIPAGEREVYSRSRACRAALIDAAVAAKKPPLNTFVLHPLCKFKLLCELTGKTVNKSEEHIWRHISGRKFQAKLEQKEREMTSSRKLDTCPAVKKSGKKPKKKQDDVNMDYPSESEVLHHDNSEDSGFWIPPVGSRWDFDDDGGDDDAVEEGEELSQRTKKQKKRMSVAMGVCSLASRKKQRKKLTENTKNDEVEDNAVGPSEELSQRTKKKKKQILVAMGVNSLVSRKKPKKFTENAKNGGDDNAAEGGGELYLGMKQMSIAMDISSLASKKKKKMKKKKLFENFKNDGGDENAAECGELSLGPKQKSIAVGASSFTSKKKKQKKLSENSQNGN